MSETRLLWSQRWQHLRRRLEQALRREGRSLWAGLRDPTLGGLALLTLLLIALGLQAVHPFALDIGQRPEEAYLEGFYPAEEGDGRTYRWTSEVAQLRIPGLGQTSYRFDWTMAAPRLGSDPAPHLRLEAAGQVLLDIPVEPQMQVYSTVLPAPALTGGDLELLLRSDSFTPPGDPRVLGIALDRLELRPLGRPILPSVGVLLWPLLTVVLAVLVARRVGWSRWAALGTGAVLALALAAALTWARPLLSPGLPYLPLAVAAAWAAVALGQETARSLFARGGAALSLQAERALWSALAFFLALRLAGVLHPALETWDLCFHWHNLEATAQGRLLFTIVSGEWRSQETLYLPSLYILLAPFWALFGGRLVPLKVAGVLLDTSSALLVAYIARRLLGQGKPAPLAAFLYLTVPQSYLIFSWGIVSNILGQWLYLLVVSFLVSPAGRLARRRPWLAAAGLLSLALLAHPGTVLLTAFILLALLGAAWLAPLAPTPRRMAWRWAGAAVAALALTTLLYYSHFAGTMWASLEQMRQGANAEEPTGRGILVRGPVIDLDLGLRAVEVSTRGEALSAGAAELAAEARAYYHTWPVALALGAVAGMALERRALAARLGGLTLIVALLFALVGLTVNLYVRYMYFLLPTVAVGTAWWLTRLLHRRWAGRVVTALAGLYLALSGLHFWIDHVLTYSAGCR